MNPGPIAVISAGRRTPIGTAGGALVDVPVVDLAAPLIRVLAAESPGSRIDEVILGNCLGPGGNIARSAGLAAGLDASVPAVTVDRQCGSGLEAVAQAAALIGSGRASIVLAGGAESASTAPWRYWPPTVDDPEPRRYTRAPFAPPGFPDPSMGEAADRVAAHLGISRARQDEWAQRSHRLAHAAVLSGAFVREILPMAELDHDQRPRPGLSTMRLARLPRSFTADGTATAGNSCGISDGAAVLTVTSGGAGLAVRGIATVGGDPGLPGVAAGQAIHRVLDATGLASRDLEAIEITEAFASVALATIDLAGLDPERVCTDGGAIGYGHPWGASGAVLLVRLLHRMERDDQTVGVAACAIGGGQGIAMLVERVG